MWIEKIKLSQVNKPLEGNVPCFNLHQSHEKKQLRVNTKVMCYLVKDATWPASTLRILPVDLYDASEAKK